MKEKMLDGIAILMATYLPIWMSITMYVSVKYVLLGTFVAEATPFVCFLNLAIGVLLMIAAVVLGARNDLELYD